ncbi:CoA transferase [Burkholderia pseudomallei]|uniref:CoA transferase n=1 Tax=Burkholderia pseudomallei TaxID=28450 RepID=UPI003AAFC82B
MLDLSKVLVGLLCDQYLGEFGIDVFKVEPVGHGDDARAWLSRNRGQSAAFLAVNHNKRSLAVDLKIAAGRQIVQTLAEKADVIRQGFRITTQPTAYRLEALRRVGVARAPIHTLVQALAHAQLAARRLLVESEHAVLGRVRNIDLPVRFHGTQRQAHPAPKLLRKHTDEVLHLTGYDPDANSRLKVSEVVASVGDCCADHPARTDTDTTPQYRRRAAAA